MSKRNIEDIYPLSPMQRGMLFHGLYAPESGVYFEQSSWTVRGSLNVAVFQRAWQRVLERHPVLRTAFVWEGLEEPLQVVHRQVMLPWTQQDWRHLTGAESSSQLAAFLAADRARGFELTIPPLVRLVLIRTGEETYHFIWSHHHLLLDGWSLPLIFQEVFVFYHAFCRQQNLTLPPVQPYRHYIAWLQQQNLAAAEAFWRQMLTGFTAPTPLIGDSPAEKRAEQPLAGEDYHVQHALLPLDTTEALRTLAHQHQLTLNTLLQGAWALLLHRYSGETEVVFGATVAGRPADLPGAEAMVGLFINTLPVRVQIQPNRAILAWLTQLQAHQAELRQYEYTPLIDIQSWSDIPRGQSLFDTILVFENYPLNEAVENIIKEGSLEIEGGPSFTRTNYPLTLAVSPGHSLGLEIGYDSRRFTAKTITRMLGHLQTILAGMAANPHQSPDALPVLTQPEQQQLLVDWNQTQAGYPQDRSIHELFEAQVEQTPAAVALVFEEQRLTYAELNHRANQLAHHLQKLGVGPETLVGICVERSVEMIIGLLGVLKAGGAYLPLDPDYPADRLAFMLQDSQASVLLTQRKMEREAWKTGEREDGKTGGVEDWRTATDPPPFHPTLVYLDTDWPAIAQESETNPVSQVMPDNLAYVIYTSGSTGQPKGTLLHHRGLVNFAVAFGRDLQVGPDSRVLQFASFSFDAATAEIFMALLSGACLYLARRETLLELPALTHLLQAAGINTVILPPAVLKLLSPQAVPELQTVVSAGEACSPDVAIRWAKGRRFFNGYGPTEATIGSAWQQITVEEVEGLTHVPIGRPTANTQVYLLDAHLQPVPLGVPGELYLGGLGLARGYLNQPGLTAERFIPNPFGTLRVKDREAGGRMKKSQEDEILPFIPHPSSFILYKTGDLARYRSDGLLEFLGRIDHQVKIRGFRIELGEIETVLEQHPAVRMAAVAATEKQLVAYVTPKGEPAPDGGELRRFLQARLPDYMLPAAFVFLAQMPLTPSGKINRRALPVGEEIEPAESYVAPRTPQEEILAEVWRQVLGVKRVGIYDNFFELGGHSLLATQLVSRIREVLQVELPLSGLFEKPTIAALAELLNHVDGRLPAPPVEPIPRQGYLPLSFAQQRLWFLDQLEPGNLFYNIPLALRLTGQLNVAALEQCLNEIIRRHETLRTTFAVADGRPVQVIAPALTLSLPVVDLTHLPEAEREAEARRLAAEESQRPFDLSQGPLLRACLLRLKSACPEPDQRGDPGQNRAEEYIVLLTMHHIISDGWSMGVLVREVAALYPAFSAGKPSPLPELTIQYADFTHWQRERLQGEELARQLAYWQEQLGHTPPLLNLPTDRPRPAVQSARGATLTFELSAELSAGLKALSQQEGVTLFMTLLTAFQTLLHRYTGQDDITVGTPIANRTRREIEGLIGFFVNTLVLRTEMWGDPSFEELLQRVRRLTLDAYAHQDLPFEMLVETLQPRRDLSHTPLFQVMFVLDNAPLEALELPDLALSLVELDRQSATFDLTLSMREGPAGLAGYIEFNTDLFNRDTVERMVGHFQTLLAGLVADPSRRISQLPILTQAEQQQLLVEWNKTATVFRDDACIHHLFEAQAEQQPQAIALTFAGQQLTYAELNRQANQLAHSLQKLGVGPETLVGISTERSPEMVVGILGVLKAGGAYVPLDPTYPPERLAYMLADSQVAVLLTQRKLAGWRSRELESSIPPSIIYLDADWPAIAQESEANPTSPVTAGNLAYVIYTSGSTGQPKGVMLQHRGLCNLTAVQRRAFHIRPSSRVLQFSPFSFDASVWETFMALANGAALCLASPETLASGPELARLLREEGITNVTLPPSVLAVLGTEELPHLETVIAAGEACPAQLAQQWAPGRDFFNAYGPTETTVCASMYLGDEDEPYNPPIGGPLANGQLYILGKNLQPVPVGVPGELHVGGVSLARGYLNRPDLTAAKFIPNPFGMTADLLPGGESGGGGGLPSAVSGRLYKTGDLVRYRADGNIEFLGRIDHQVKVRGFRIELGEIETALRRHPALQESVVVTQETGRAAGKRLVAYVVPNQEPGPASSELRDFLRETLPEYMIPSLFVELETLPLSPSGKVDRRALPEPDRMRPEQEQAYVAPRNETEAKLAEICAGLLELERVGIYDNFFELGGHSLLATQFISRVRETFQIELPLRALFEKPSVAGIAEAIEQAHAVSAQPQAPAIVPISRESRRMKRSALAGDGNGAGNQKDSTNKLRTR